jgi:1-acyl-sn-glycerol-3-phosphate acyltransferase
MNNTTLGLSLLFLVSLAALGWMLLGRLQRRCEAANQVDWGKPWLNRLDGLNRIFCRRYHRLRCDPIPLPDQGPAILVSNHVSGLDPLLMIAASRRPLRFLIAQEQYHRFGLNRLYRAIGCIPVDRSGRPEKAFREARKALAAGEVVALFPHGKIHLDDEPHRRIKPGASRLAHLAGCPVYPARITGVAGQGHTLLAIPWRSRARLKAFPALDCEALPDRECLNELQALLDGKRFVF